MSKVIFGLIGLALALTTFACKRSEPPVAEVHPARAPDPLPKAPEVTLERSLATEWTEIRVAYAWHEECYGTAVGDQLLITRKDERMMISGREEITFGKFRKIPERPLEKDEFDQIVNKLRQFHALANSETAEAKPFESFAPEERERERAAYYKMIGRPYFGPTSCYFYVQFDPNTAGTTIQQSFTDPRSANGYKNWLQKTWKWIEAVR
jgi:hypothetical protein